MKQYEDALHLYEKHDFGAALKIVDQLISENAFEASYYYLKGCIEIKMSNYDSASELLDKAISLQPENPDFYCAQATIRFEVGDYTGALLTLRHAIDLDPTHYLSLASLAALLSTCPDDAFRNGRQAVKYAKTSCELSNWKHWKCLSALAAAYAELGDFASASRWATRAFLAAPEQEKEERQERLILYRQGHAFRRAPLPRP